MTNPAEIKAPPGWLDYAAGKHFSEAPELATSSPEADYLTLLKQIDLGLLGPQSPIPDSPFDWQTLEQAAIVEADNGKHWPARLSALNALESQVTQRVSEAPETNDAWSEKVALGRYYQNLAAAIQRNGEHEVLDQVTAALAKADQAFKGIEGEDFFRAQSEVIRGRSLAWKNDVIGANASQSSALSIFQKYGNKHREADAAYELAIANLDANLPDPALRLFDLAISAHRELDDHSVPLARSLQSNARALIAKARACGVDEAPATFVAEAKQDALEAYMLSAPDADLAEISALSAGLDVPVPEKDQVTHEGFRAAMAARDLGAATLLESELGMHPQSATLEIAKGWLQLAAKQLGHGDVFADNGRNSMRQKLSGKAPVDFSVLRIAQLEFEILAETAPDQAAPLLIETGKRYANQTYTIECFQAAARCFEREATRLDDASLANEAEYWHHRAARIALSIGARSHSDLEMPETLSPDLKHALTALRGLQNFQILRYEAANETALHADTILSGRQTSSRLILLAPSLAKTLDLDLLTALAERGDIPQILDSGSLEGGAAYLIQEVPSGRRLSETLGRDLTDTTRMRLAARLCRTVAGLLRAHGNRAKNAPPLFITLEDIVIEPGNRWVVTGFGLLGRKQAPSIGWSFLYPDTPTSLKQGADAQAVAKMLILLFGVESLKPSNLWRESYRRRALSWFQTRKPLDQLPLAAVGALSKLAAGKLKVDRSYEKSLAKTSDARARDVKGVAELLYLASLLDSAAGAQKDSA